MVAKKLIHICVKLDNQKS